MQNLLFCKCALIIINNQLGVLILIKEGSQEGTGVGARVRSRMAVYYLRSIL